MTVSVAGRPIQDANAMSPLGRLALAFIDGGPEWLSWAIADLTARYEFPDETTLVGQVQSGLHASRFALLPRLELMVSPIKLMTLGLADLRMLAKAEGGDDSAVAAAQVTRVLSDHQLATRGDLAAGQALLSELGLAASPLFQAMDFEDHLALWQLARMAPPPEETAPALRQEAADFAAAQARTPLEFCDYCNVYLDLGTPLADASPAQRSQAATGALQTLLPLMFGVLDCPQIDGLPSPSEVDQAVSNWLARGRQIGFARLSQAVQQIVRHTSFQGQSGDAAQKAVRLYLQSAQAFLAANRPVQGRLGQDGATCLFALEAGSLRAELHVGPGGVISLRDFGPRTPSSTTTPEEDPS
ncbi:hypothetical protein [Piscinibacter terrae]|uniref:Uncharacterized protein n=1 Tax=Piscinibacter terrae TaxID=2496871 RepID=A0A3N7HIN4_9BURK|nr:hypothetical protein [Albitalea terrae]RQP21900.1 hypothetical protein DZC73_26025 [Albitalea terrae]